MVYFGVDVGSSFVKGAVLDLEAARLSSVVRRPFPPPIVAAEPGQFEVELPAIVDAVREVLSELCAREARPGRGVLFCGQMGGVLLVDRAGNPLTHYLSWRDQRTLAAHSEESYLALARRRLGDEFFAQLGRELKPGSATSLLFWLAENGQLSQEIGRAHV